MTRVTDALEAAALIRGKTTTTQQVQNAAEALVFADPYHLGNWADISYEVNGVVIADGGTGYVVDDILTIVGGTGTPATLIVTSENAGVIDGLGIQTIGSYTIRPTNPASLSGGSGSGATINGSFREESTPREGTNEEKADLFLTSLQRWVQGWLEHKAKDEKREADTPAFEAAIQAAGDAARADMD